MSGAPAGCWQTRPAAPPYSAAVCQPRAMEHVSPMEQPQADSRECSRGGHRLNGHPRAHGVPWQPGASSWHKPVVSKASLAGLWAVKSHPGEHSKGHFDSWLASKAQPYNGRNGRSLSYPPLLPSRPVPLLGLQHPSRLTRGWGCELVRWAEQNTSWGNRDGLNGFSRDHVKRERQRRQGN